MLKNYLKIAFRNLLQHKAFSFINIAGLAIGMSCSILVMLWVQDELSYDRFHAKADRIYRVTASLMELDVHAAVSSAPLAHAFKNEIPEIKNSIRLNAYRTDLMQVEDRMFEEKAILFADSNFFEFFSFQFIQGNAATALQQPEGIVITEKMAKKYFGNEDALGKTIRKNHKDDFVVTAVLANIPENSHLQFDFVQPMSFLARTERDLKENIWDNFNFYTYVELNDNVDATPATIAKLESRFKEIYKANEPNLKVDFHLQPLNEIHLYSDLMADVPGGGNIQYVYIFIIVGIFILAVACINFMNLATARSARRAKEVGLRKAAGAMRFQLIRQFLAESSLIAFIALLLAVLIVIVTLPSFNDLAGKNLSINFLNIKLVSSLLAITLITGLIAGSYPALFLSGFVPAKVLKGNLKSGAASSVFRNTMVVVQFTVSITLLVGTTVIYNQLQFIRTHNLGFDKENLIYTSMTGELWNKYQTFRSSLEQNSLTSEFAFVSDIPTNLTNATIGVEWEGKSPDAQPLFSNAAIDENFIDVFNLTILSGRGFSKEFRADTSNLILNERAVATMGMDVATAVGKSVTFWQKKGVIVGVVKDFNFKPIQKPIEPLILRLNTWGGVAVVRAKAGQTETAIKAMEKIVKELNPEYPFSYNFVDQEIDNQYKAEQRLGSLFTVFAGLAIFISCLGLYGLSAFLAERRTKEIGVRKVLGASDFHVVYLLSKTFTKPILIATLFAIPLAWFGMNQWLEGFAYHIDIHWSIFLFAFLASLFVAWLTVSYESIKAAVANPAESLRSE
ncbi:MAG: ABC transporter permease [Chryseolinea sp.]